MSRVLVIGLNTFRENLRDKILYNLVIFALLLIGSAVLLVRLNHGDNAKLIIDLGLASLNLFGTIMAVFLGIGLVSKEVRSQNIETIISKPMYRHEFLLGKYLGLLLTLGVNTLLMFVGLLGVLLLFEVSIESLIYKAVVLMFLELMIITAVALVFSTFTTTSLSAILTLSIYVIGHLLTDLKSLSMKLESGSWLLLNGLYYALPNLEDFNLKGRVAYHVEIGTLEMVWTVVYGLLYTSFLLAIAALIFQRRDFR
jgi:ABC-type transport system involved in multi-copper enzyme maturation permease subunit